jgi:hypothetical protein
MVGNFATNWANDWSMIRVSESTYLGKCRGLELGQRVNLTELMQDKQRLADQIHTETHSGAFSVENRGFGLAKGRLDPLITANIPHDNFQFTGDPADGYVDVNQAPDLDSYRWSCRHLDVQT